MAAPKSVKSHWKGSPRVASSRLPGSETLAVTHSSPNQLPPSSSPLEGCRPKACGAGEGDGGALAPRLSRGCREGRSRARGCWYAGAAVPVGEASPAWRQEVVADVVLLPRPCGWRGGRGRRSWRDGCSSVSSSDLKDWACACREEVSCNSQRSRVGLWPNEIEHYGRATTTMATGGQQVPGC